MCRRGKRRQSPSNRGRTWPHQRWMTGRRCTARSGGSARSKPRCSGLPPRARFPDFRTCRPDRKRSPWASAHISPETMSVHEPSGPRPRARQGQRPRGNLRRDSRPGGWPVPRPRRLDAPGRCGERRARGDRRRRRQPRSRRGRRLGRAGQRQAATSAWCSSATAPRAPACSTNLNLAACGGCRCCSSARTTATPSSPAARNTPTSSTSAASPRPTALPRRPSTATICRPCMQPRARRSQACAGATGPYLLECMTYRMAGHYVGDAQHTARRKSSPR